MQETITSMFQWSTQTMFTCGRTPCRKSRRLGVPQVGWVLQLPILGNMSLDAALESYFFAREFEAHCSSCGRVSGEECARLCKLPVTLAIHFKRANKVNPLTCLSVCLSVCLLYDAYMISARLHENLLSLRVFIEKRHVLMSFTLTRLASHTCQILLSSHICCLSEIM